MIKSFPAGIFLVAARYRRKRRVLSLAIVAGCVASLLPLSAFSAHAQTSPDAVSATVVVPATIEAFFSTDLFANTSGYVSRVNNDIGDRVKQGDLLAVIDNPELQAQFDRAEAAVQQATAALDVAKRQLAGLQADLVLQEVTLNRQKALFTGNVSSAQMLDEARARHGVSSANVETGKARITSAEADLQMAKAEAERLRALLQYDRIVAPFDGVVTRRLVNPGDLVQGGTSPRTDPLFTCQRLDVVRVFAEAPEATASAIHSGLPVDVRVYGPTAVVVHGTVTRVAGSLLAATRTMRVEIDLQNNNGKLLPGMYAQVTLQLERQQAHSAGPRHLSE